MDKRLDQIKEGAGLEESRINEELVEFLKKHSDKFTLVILIAAIAIVGQKWLHQYQVNARNEAWAEYATATTLGPVSLVEVANEHRGRPGLRLQALSDAADLYLQIVRLDLKEVVALDLINRPGAMWSMQYTDEDKLGEEERNAYLDAADDLYATLIEEAGSDERKRLYKISGLFGRAAVAEERRDYDGAGGFYEQVKAEAEVLFPIHAAQADLRLASLGELETVVMPIPEPTVELPDLTLPGEGAGQEDPGAFFDELLNQGEGAGADPSAPSDEGEAEEPPAETGDEPTGEDVDPGEETGSDGSGA